MGKKRHSSTSAAPEVHQGVTPHSPFSIAKKSGTEPNSSSTTKAPPQAADPAPATHETTKITLKTASAKKPKTTHENPVVVNTTSSNKDKSTHEKTQAAISVKPTSSGGSRRSSRLLNVAKTTTPNEEIEDITSTNSEEEEEEMQPMAKVTQRKNYSTVPENGDTGKKSLEELVKLFEAQQKTIAELKAEIHFVIILASLMIDYQISNNVKPSDLKYKNLYIDSKKENEALTKEVHQLRMDIEHARGRAVGLGEGMMTVVVAVARTAFQGGDE
ncbi:hypothetical protein LINPERPRIM_LOCUS11019 [Linum perenne]